MTVFWVAIAIFSKIICTENRMIPLQYIHVQPTSDEESLPPDTENVEDNPYEVIGLKQFQTMHNSYETIQNGESKKPCPVMFLSNVQNPSMQTLLRKYKYDANGILIPSSVKYFIKFTQGFGSAPLLVPLNDKSFSPLGGFVSVYNVAMYKTNIAFFSKNHLKSLLVGINQYIKSKISNYDFKLIWSILGVILAMVKMLLHCFRYYKKVPPIPQSY